MQLETAVLIALPPSLLLESQSKPHHAKLNFPTRPLPIPPPHGPTEIGGTVQTAFGCIDDILRPTSEHDQLRTPRLQVNFAKTATHAILRRTARPRRHHGVCETQMGIKLNEA